MVALNLGCGIHYDEKMINCDLYESKVDIRLDAVELPFKTESVDEIVAMQLLEHLSIVDADRAIKEWNRVLKINGILYIGVPDLERCLALAEAIKGMGPYRWKTISMFIYGSQTDEGQYHKSGYAPEYLEAFLEDNGFKVENINYDTPRRATPWFGMKARKCLVS